MIGFENIPGVVEAAILVGIVLVEAMVLYVGYGMIEDRIAPPIHEAIANV